MNSAARFKKIAEFAKIHRYLEIGVDQGKTFNSVNFNSKVAVDPKFRFDFVSLATNHVVFYEMKSDDFFVSKNELKPFDLIFLDGLHTFDQTLRDLNNALMLSHDNTIIVIDDVYPCDVYSALRDGIEARTLRSKFHPQASRLGAWHGDVYKLMFFIHDFYPMLSFVTIDIGSGNPQSIVFKKSRPNFLPKFSSVEAIERLDFFEFHKHKGLLNLKPEEEAINILYSWLVEKRSTK